MSRSAGSFITAGPENLRCCACPNLPHFTNASHLLTHLCSKYHLKIIFELELRAKGDHNAATQLDEYHRWYEAFGVDRALAHRQKLKEEKVSSAAREREEEQIKAKKIKEEDKELVGKTISLDPSFTSKTTILRTPTRPSLMSLPTPTQTIYQSIDPGLLQKTRAFPSNEETAFPKIEVDDSVNLFAQDQYHIEDEFFGLAKGEPDMDLDPQSLGLPNDAVLMMQMFRFKKEDLFPGVPRTGSSFFDGEEDSDPAEMKVKGKVWPGMKCYDWATPKLRAKRLAANAQKKALDAIKAAEIAAETAAVESAAKREQAVYEEYVEDTEAEEEDASYDEDVEIDDSDATQSVEPQTPRHYNSPTEASSPNQDVLHLLSPQEPTSSYHQLAMGGFPTPPTFLFTPSFSSAPMNNGYSIPPAGFLQATFEQTQWYQQGSHQQSIRQNVTNPYTTPNITKKRTLTMMSPSLSPLSGPPTKREAPSFAWCEPEDEVGIFGSSSASAYQNMSRQHSFEEFYKFSETVQPSTTLEDKTAQYVDTLLEIAVGAEVNTRQGFPVQSSKSSASLEAESSSAPLKPSTLSGHASRERPHRRLAQSTPKTRAPEPTPMTRPVTRSAARRTKVEVALRTPTESSLSSLTSVENEDEDYFE